MRNLRNKVRRIVQEELQFKRNLVENVIDPDEFRLRLTNPLIRGEITNDHVNMLGRDALVKLLNPRKYKPTEQLYINGNLNLSDTKLRSLPNNLTVSGNVDLSGCKILNSLPINLQVGGNLDLRSCPSLSELPKGLHVDGFLYLRNTPLADMWSTYELTDMIQTILRGYVGKGKVVIR